MLPAVPAPLAHLLNQSPARRTALAGMAALHMALLSIWLHSRPPAQADTPDLRPAIIWLRWSPPTAQTSPAPPRRVPATPPPAAVAATIATGTAPAARKTAHAATGSPANAAAPPPDLPAPPAPVETPAGPGTAAPSRSADDILQQAKRDIGKIDQDMRANTFQGKLIKAPADSPTIRLAQGFDEAAAVTPNKWFEKPKVETLLDAGGYSRRINRVRGALGTYCITTESNHAPDGIDVMKNGIHQKLTDCGTHPPPVDTMQAH